MTLVQPNTSNWVPLLVRQVHETGSFRKHVDLEKHNTEANVRSTGLNTTRRCCSKYMPRLPVILNVLRLDLLEQYDLTREGRTSLNGHRIVKGVMCKSMYSRYEIFSAAIPSSRVCKQSMAR